MRGIAVKTIMLRELRRLRTPILVALGVLAIATIAEGFRPERGAGHEHWLLDIWALAMPLLALTLGCALAAAERGSHETQFARAWPVSRRHEWAGRLLAGLLLVASLCALTTACTATGDGDPERLFSAIGYDERPMALLTSTLCLLVFSVGFMVGGFAASPFSATVISIVLLGAVCPATFYLINGPIADAFGPRLGIALWRPLGHAVTLLSWLALMMAAATVGSSWLAARGAAPLETRRTRRRTLIAWPPLTALAVALVVAGTFPFGEPTPDDIRLLDWAQPLPDGRIAFLEGWSMGMREDVSSYHLARAWVLDPATRSLTCVGRWPCEYVGPTDEPGRLLIDWGRRSVWLRGEDGGPRWLGRAEASVGTDSASERISPDRRWLYWSERLIELRDGLPATEVPRPERASSLHWAADGSAVFFREDRSETSEAAILRQQMPGGQVEALAPMPGWAMWASRISPDGSVIAWVGDERYGMHGMESGMDPGMEPPMEPVIGGPPGGWMEPSSQVEVLRVADGATLMVQHTESMERPWAGGGRYLWLERAQSILVVDTEHMEVATRLDLQAMGPEDAQTGVASQGDAEQNSPDGTQRVFWTIGYHNADPFSFTKTHMWLANADGSDARLLLTDERNDAPRMCGWIDDGHVLLIRDSRWLSSIDVATGAEELLYETPMTWEEWHRWRR